MGEEEIRPIEPKGFESYPMNMPLVPRPEAVDVPMCKNLISDSVHWFDLTKLFVRESAISLILSMKGNTMDNDQKASATAIATGIVSLVGLFGLSWPLEAVTAVVIVGVTILGILTNKKDAAK